MEIEKEIIIALIGAGATIIAATIGVVGNRRKASAKKEQNIKINQTATGRSNTQIGIQINSEKEVDLDE